MIALPDLRRRALASLIPPSRLQLSERIEGNVHLPQAVTALPRGRCYLASASALISEYLRVAITAGAIVVMRPPRDPLYRPHA
jgi:hypothetical protein